MRDSKITFRVSDELLEEVDSIDESRSEIMRQALRMYLEGGMRGGVGREGTLDALLTRRIEEVVDRKMREQDVNVTVNVPEMQRAQGPTPQAPQAPGAEGVQEREKNCPQCGDELEEDDVYCSNCGSKASQRVFCECGDEVRSDWSFCPRCGRRTPSGHALHQG